MGMLSSCIKKIEAVRFEPFPSNRAVAVEKLVRIDHCVYALGPRGTLYTTGELAGKVCYTGTNSDYSAVRALLAFGLINKAEAVMHGENKRLQDKMFDEYRAVVTNVECLTKAGIKLTPKQKQTLADMRKRLDVKRLPYFVQGVAARKLGLKG